MSKKHSKDSASQQKLIDAYLGFTRANNRHPMRADMRDLGFSRDQIRAHFVSLERLQQHIRENVPGAFADMFDRDQMTPERVGATADRLKRYRRFVVTTAVTGCEVDENFYESIQTYCELNDAAMVVLVCEDPAAEKTGGFLDPALMNDLVVFTDVQLNRNIGLISIKMSPKQIDPVTGVDRMGHRNGSFVYASPKQRLKMVATSNHALPHACWTTGAVTRANYDTERYMSKRVSYLAEHDHIIGALIVEIESDQIFHCRPVQADRDGCFADLGVMYTRDGVHRYQPQALVLGDWHSGSTCPKVMDATFESDGCIFDRLQPRELILHDFFDGLSINHHEEKDLLLRARRAELGKLDLQAECVNCASELNFLTGLAPCRIVPSNHDDFLRRYLTESRYVRDPQNLRFASLLVSGAIDGRNPLRLALERIGLKHPERVHWLGIDEDYKVAGIELGCHGHKGPNGSKGSARGMETAYGKSVSGHTHTPQILRDVYVAGTSTHLHLDYNQGPSSWLNAHVAVYPNGMRQMLSIINGAYALPPTDKLTRALKHPVRPKTTAKRKLG